MGDVLGQADVPSGRPRSTQPTLATDHVCRVPVESVTAEDTDARCLALGDAGRGVDSTVADVRVLLNRPPCRTVYQTVCVRYGTSFTKTAPKPGRSKQLCSEMLAEWEHRLRNESAYFVSNKRL